MLFSARNFTLLQRVGASALRGASVNTFSRQLAAVPSVALQSNVARKTLPYNPLLSHKRAVNMYSSNIMDDHGVKHHKLMEYNSWALIIYMPIAMGYQYFVLGDVTGAFDVNYILAALLSVNTYLAIDEALEDYIRIRLFGKTVQSMSRVIWAGISATAFAGLLLFNYYDVGLLQAAKKLFLLH